MTLFLSALILAQAAPVAEDVQVRANRTREALETCIAARCDTPQDVRLSIAHAEAQFVAGRYRDARRTLDAAIRRQKGAAATYPREVASLHNAASTINLHHGDMKWFVRHTAAQKRILQANLPADDPQVRAATLLSADSSLLLRKPRSAIMEYDEAAAEFRRQGEERLAALATLRAASIEAEIRAFDRAQRRLDQVSQASAGNDRDVQSLSAIVASRLALRRGRDPDEAATASTNVRTTENERPLLIKEAKIGLTERLGQTDVPIGKFIEGPGSLLWADVGFRIAPDGTVSDVEVIRGSQSQGWVKPLLGAIADRRYAALDVANGHPGLYRVERISLRPEYGTMLGSRIRSRMGRPEIQVIDMTEDAPPIEDAPPVVGTGAPS